MLEVFVMENGTRDNLFHTLAINNKGMVACKEFDWEVTFGSFEESPQVEFLEKLVVVEDLQRVGFLAMENRRAIRLVF